MKLKWIEFENSETGLKLNRIDFQKDVTLLVGLSGAGKTQIIRSIAYSFRLAKGKMDVLEPYHTKMCIEIKGHEYIWEYFIGSASTIDEMILDEKNALVFLHESLVCDGQSVFYRDNNKAQMKGYADIPMPQKAESLVYQYSEDAALKEFAKGMKLLYDIDIDKDVRFGILSNKMEEFVSVFGNLFEEHAVKDIIDIKMFSHLPGLIKLYAIKTYFEEIFANYLSEVQVIFPEVEDINIAQDPVRKSYYLELVVYGKKIHQKHISNGMLKTFYYILDVFTCDRDSLIIVDEFENGLGVNCIDTLMEVMLLERPDIQYIFTSHHPKIINSEVIDYCKWKIIEREYDTIHNYDCNDEGYDLGNNRHNAYFNLLNKWAFEGKI